jgi:hypothetical protein
LAKRLKLKIKLYVPKIEDIEGNVNKMDKNPVLLQLGLIFLPTQDFGL